MSIKYAFFVLLTVSYFRCSAAAPELSHAFSEQLSDAIQSGNQDLVKQLLNQGADINYREELEGLTPLMEASLLADEPMVQFLLTCGAQLPDPQQRETVKRLSMTWGAEFKKEKSDNRGLEVIDKNAILAGLRPSAEQIRREQVKQMSGEQPITEEQRKELLAKKHRKHLKESGKALLKAAVRDDSEMVQELLTPRTGNPTELSCIVNVETVNHETPLTLAAMNGNEAMVKLLFRSGARFPSDRQLQHIKDLFRVDNEDPEYLSHVEQVYSLLNTNKHLAEEFKKMQDRRTRRIQLVKQKRTLQKLDEAIVVVLKSKAGKPVRFYRLETAKRIVKRLYPDLARKLEIL